MGGGGGSQSVTQEFKPPGYTTESGNPASWQSYLYSAGQLAGTPYQQSGIPHVAPETDYQNTSNQLAYNLALYGSPMGNASNGAAMNAAQGNYANPFSQNVEGIASGQAYNPWAEGVYNFANNNSNPYLESLNSAMGAQNPYFGDEATNNMISNSANQMTSAFKNGTAVQEDAAAHMAGAYGGSADQELKARNAAGLSSSIGNMATQTLQQQQNFNNQAFNQQIQNQYAGVNLGTNALNGQNAQLLQALGLGSNMYQGDVQNQLAANGQGGNFWNSDIGNILSGAALGYQGNNDYRQNLGGLQSAGNNQQSYFQKLLDDYQNQWNTESGYDQTMNDMLGNALSRASGSYGGNTTTGGGPSTLSGLLGLGATAGGLYSLYKG